MILFLCPYAIRAGCLNPYCNGCTSMIQLGVGGSQPGQKGLNPYCNGCTSMMQRRYFKKKELILVSILIVMDVLQ